MQGSLCDECAPRSKYGDGRICRACAARLGGVLPDTVSAWVSRGKVTNVRYEGKRPWFWPAEIIQVEWDLHARERQRLALLASLVPGAESAALPGPVLPRVLVPAGLPAAQRIG